MNKNIVPPLVIAGGILILALVATYARQLGYIDGETVTRLVIGANGLMVAWLGNRMPKTIAPTHCAARASRVGGWSMVLSGLIYTALWAFAPMNVALIGGCGAVLVGMAVTVGYCLSLRNKARAA